MCVLIISNVNNAYSSVTTDICQEVGTGPFFCFGLLALSNVDFQLCVCQAWGIA